jgi:hypothetical protein
MGTYKGINYPDKSDPMVTSNISYNKILSVGSQNFLTGSNVPIHVADETERETLYKFPGDGFAVWREDNGTEERYSESEPAGWYSATTGLMNVKPTDVVFSGTLGLNFGSVSESGLISFTNATSILVNGIFGPAFKNYKMFFNLQSTSAAGSNIQLSYASEGVPDTSANYYRSNFFSNSTTVSGGYGAGQTRMADLIGAGPSANVRSGLSEVTFFNPYLGRPTSQVNFVGSGPGIAPIISFDNGYYNSADVRFDGFYIYPSTSINFTGSMLVYGFN